MSDLTEREPGNHYKFLFRSEPTALRSMKRMTAFLQEVVTAIGCRSLMEPVVLSVEEQVREQGDEPWTDEGGITGVVVLSTSHIAMHTWPLKGKGVLDVYSCRPFTCHSVIEVLDAYYEPTERIDRDLSYGLSWRIGAR